MILGSTLYLIISLEVLMVILAVVLFVFVSGCSPYLRRSSEEAR
jgi:hypothetical protein